MCFKGKCCGLEIETGCLIWAIISTIWTGLGLLTTIGVAVYIFMYATVAGPAVLPYIPPILLMTFISSISFMFSMFLLVGVIKKNGSYVKAYFVYVVVCTMYVIVSFIILQAHIVEMSPLFFGSFTICGPSVLSFHLVRRTYIKFDAASKTLYSHMFP